MLGQYRGAKRVKFIIWVTRSAPMLKFFAPLLSDAQVATVYYTGQPKLSTDELQAITASRGNIFIHQRRPQLASCFARTIIAFESAASGVASATTVEDVDPSLRASWCGLYCGGSKRIQDELAKAARKWGVGWQAELFDW